MFLDASAIVAILKREPSSEVLLKVLAASRTKPVCSPLSRFEAVVSLARACSGQHRASTPERIDDARAAVDRLLVDLGAESIPITDDIGTRALSAAQTYGRAVGHPADLNFGDCFAYACAKEQRADLLYIGGDFALTDLA
jgi:ribonuclease VapC